ncbi:hypothetical protein CRP3_gp01 [Roseobacter phage CRP-3]|nr:hypothetical protein CRP3_gp01 [Roseobacter phage CRP-3]
MILPKHMAQELGNALISASEAANETGTDQVVLKLDSDTIFTTTAVDDGYDEGFHTIARITSSS